MNRFDLIKSLAPGFMPLLVFIAADAVWGTRIGLIVAVVSGIGEFAWSWIREKIIDKFLLLDIGLITFLGAISLWQNNEIFFKLKPAVIELIFCLLLGVSAFSKTNVVFLMSRRYLKNMSIDDAQMVQLRQKMRSLFVIFMVHTAFIVYAAFFMSKQAWAFVSGGLFYIVFVLYLGFEISKKRFAAKKWKKLYADDEWFDVVDMEGQVRGRAPRTVCHSGTGLLHPVIHMHIIDSRDRFFLQKRPLSKQIQPGKWDTAVGGHVSSGESIEDALKREAAEELGLKTFKAELIARYRWDTDVESELVYLFIARYDGSINVNKSEVDDGGFWKIKQIRQKYGSGFFTMNFELEFKLILENILKIKF